jgi:Raf kinase inhibitor-like YbhB/YbcL family protein
MKITCAAFANNKTVPAKHLLDGDNLSPAVQWTDIPDGTISLALILNDPDAPINGLDKPPGNWTHWIVYGLKPATKELPEGIQRNLIQRCQDSPNIIVAKNDFGNDAYDGPCPPPGHGVHRYQLILLALNTFPLCKALPNRKSFDKAIEGHVLATAMTVGTYETPKK